MNWLCKRQIWNSGHICSGWPLGKSVNQLTLTFVSRSRDQATIRCLKIILVDHRYLILYFAFRLCNTLSVRLRICSLPLAPPFQHFAKLGVIRIWCHLYVCTIYPFVPMIMESLFIHVAKYAKVSRATVAVYRRALTGPVSSIVQNYPKSMKEWVFSLILTFKN